MSVYKDEKTGKWYALAWYHDWKGEGRQKCKRGFETKKEAQDWERSYVQQNAAGIDMTFEAFCGLYEKDRRPRLKESTWLTKENIIKNKLIPAFGKMMMSEIETKHIIAWQNELLAYRDEFKKPYSATYLKTVHNQLVAILNHAVKHYGLKSNPASKVCCIGSKEREEMNFWTKEEYMKFAEAIMDKPMSYYAFEMLYWCGIREGEMLALTPADFNFTKKTVRINKTFQRIHGQDLITSPKTRKSVRTVEMPDFLCDEMQDYIKSLYKVQKNDRIFPITKSYLQHEMRRGSKEAGVVAYEKEPIFTADALFYNGTYYGIGEDHKEFIPDKMTDQDYYILTLAAIVRELERANMRTVDVPGLLLRGAPQVVSRQTEK